jgi:MFS family permease
MARATALPSTTAPPRTPSQQRWVLALASVASVASLMVALDALVVSTALSSIRRSLGASLGEVGWTVDAYALSFAVLLMAASALGDRRGWAVGIYSAITGFR